MCAFTCALICQFLALMCVLLCASMRALMISCMSALSSYVCVCTLMCLNACSHAPMYVLSCVYSRICLCSYTLIPSYTCVLTCLCVCVIKKNTCTPICVLSSTSSFVCSHMSFISHVASCICSCICAPICELRDLFVLTCGVPDLNKDNNMCLILTRCTATKIPCCAPGSHTCPPSERWGRCACLRGYALGDRTEGR